MLYVVLEHAVRGYSPMSTTDTSLTDLFATPAAEPQPCTVCGGEGLYPVHDQSGVQLYSIRCPHCGGSGTEDPDSTPRCH